MIDLRSDTVTKPTAEMKEAMFNAPVGDDVFGEDESINTLQKFAADMFGMEAGLFCPSGTMTNQIALTVHLSPGDEVICSRQSHIYCYEGGGIARNAGASTRLIEGASGIISAEDVKKNINNPDDVHFPISRLVSLENTSNRGGGICYDIDAIKEIKKVCNEHGLGLHLDGARLFNALVAKNQSALEYGELFDSISLCLSKGLGAPVGSVLIGTKDFIKKSHRVRKVFGGGMRQAGIIAAGGLYAMEHHINRLEIDHRNAKILAEAAKGNAKVESVPEVETNIVMLNVNVDAKKMVADLENKGVLCYAMDPTRVRLVTHLDNTQEQISQACDILRAV